MALLLLIVAMARADDAAWAEFVAVRDGTPARLSKFEATGAAMRFADDLDAFSADWRARSADATLNGPCRRFARVISGLSLTLATNARRLSEEGDPAFLALVRTEILLPSFLSLQDRVARGREDGAGFLDPRDGSVCAYPERAKLASKFASRAEQARHFLRDVMGSPGLRGFDEQVSRLLRLTAREEGRGERLSRLALVGTFATSVLFWEFAPAAAIAAARVLPGSLGAIATAPLAVYAVRSTALAAEGVGYSALDHELRVSAGAVGDASYLGTWDEQITQLELLMGESPATRLLPPLTLVMGQYAMLMEPWLKAQAGTLVKAGAAP